MNSLDNPKTPLSARWAQMSKQEQLIEHRKMEIQARLDANRRSKTSKSDKPAPSPVNVFSNDGSFMDQFRKMAEKKTPGSQQNRDGKKRRWDNEWKKSNIHSPSASIPSVVLQPKHAFPDPYHQRKPETANYSQSNPQYGNPNQYQKIPRVTRPPFNTHYNPGENRTFQNHFGLSRTCEVALHAIPEPMPIDALSIPPPKPIDAMLIPPPKPIDAMSIPPPMPLEPVTIPPPRPLEPSTIPKPRPLEPVKIPKPKPLEPVTIPKPKPLEPVTIPKPRPLEPVTIPKPRPLEVVAIPPPRPLEMASIPPPKPLEILTIPPPRPLEPLSIPKPRPLEPVIIPPPKPLETATIPPPKPLGTIPPPKLLEMVAIPPPKPVTIPLTRPFEPVAIPRSIDLQAIPPPLPLQLNHIPKPVELNQLHHIPNPIDQEKLNHIANPMDLDLLSIPPPPLDAVLSADVAADHQMASRRRQHSTGPSASRFPTSDIANDSSDKYEPEFSLQDDDDDDSDDDELKVHNVIKVKKEDSDDDCSAVKYKAVEDSCGLGIKVEVNDDMMSVVEGKKVKVEVKDEGVKVKGEREKKRKSRWGQKTEESVSEAVLDLKLDTHAGVSERPQLSKITRQDPGLLSYAANTYGTTALSEEDWSKCEDNYKVNLLYHEMLGKRREVERLAASGRYKYEYDSDEELDEQGTWEHRLRQTEMEATARWAGELTRQAGGKHHIGDFLPPAELQRFMDKYIAVKGGEKEPDLSDYKEFKLTEDNKGFQMLQKLGWNEGQGLGADSSGIVEPVNKAPQRSPTRGLGVSRVDGLEEDDDEFDAYRKRMMLAYRFRPNPLNNPRRPYY